MFNYTFIYWFHVIKEIFVRNSLCDLTCMQAHNYELYKQDYEMTESGYFFDIAPH